MTPSTTRRPLALPMSSTSENSDCEAITTGPSPAWRICQYQPE
ncbi:MAG: hypothetical protein WDM84_07610 [Bauldia sp.]